jgi:hypothetical protein
MWAFFFSFLFGLSHSVCVAISTWILLYSCVRCGIMGRVSFCFVRELEKVKEVDSI